MYSFSSIDSYYKASQKHRIDAPLFNLYLNFLKKIFYYYENDPKLTGLSNELLYEIKYVYNEFNGKFPLSIYSNVVQLESLSEELPKVLKDGWKLFYDRYFKLTLNI